MDPWNMFNTPTSEPTLMDFNRGANSNSSINRYNSMNGHGGVGSSSMNSSNMNPYGPMNGQNSSMNGANGQNSSMNLSSSFNSHSSTMNNIGHYGTGTGNSSINYCSGMSNNSPGGINSFSNSGMNSAPNSMNVPYNLNTSMPPPASQNSLPSPNAYPPNGSSSRNRFANFYDQATNNCASVRTEHSFPPPPPPAVASHPNNGYYNNSNMSSGGNSSGMYGGNGSVNMSVGNNTPMYGASNSSNMSGGSSSSMYGGSGGSNSGSSGGSMYGGNGGSNSSSMSGGSGGGGGNTSGMYGGNGGSNSSNIYQQQQQHHSSSMNSSVRPPVTQPQQQSTTNYYSDNSTSTNGSGSGTTSFPPIGEFTIGTFTMGANGVPAEGSGPESNNRSFCGPPNMNGAANVSSDSNQNVRETGIIEKLLQTYGFIQCCERQARLFFHFSQFDGNTDHLRIGDPVEFEVTFDRRTGKPIASTVQKISPEVVLGEERVVGAVTTELNEGGNETQGRISYENRGECFFLPYGKDDVEGYVTLKPGDKVSFQIATNQRTGNLAARHVRLENPAEPVRYQGVVSAINEAYGFIERADVVDEIYFHVSETKHIPGGLKLGDDVDFCITMLSGKEVAIELIKLQVGSVVFEDTSQELVRGQVLKTVERTPRHNPKEPLPGRIRYRGKDRSEVEVKFGERDQRGEFTLRHGDWVEFNIATDRRDRLQKATNITLLDESFSVSGERREHGVVHEVLCAECYGYILCCDRDLLLHFHFRELLNPPQRIEKGQEFTFTVTQDSSLAGINKSTATRIEHLAPGTVQFEVFVQENLQGQVHAVARQPGDLCAPTTAGSVVPPKEQLGTITYLVEGQRHNMDYAYHADMQLISIGDKVMFSVFFNKRLKKLIATKVTLIINTTSVTADVTTVTTVTNMTSSVDSAMTVVSSANIDNLSSMAIGDTVSAAVTPAKGTTTTVVAADRPTSPVSVTKKIVAPSPATNKNTVIPKQQRQLYKGYVAALKESFGFVETVNHDKEIFFHYSNVENNDSSKLELGDEVQYNLSSRVGPNAKVSAENISVLPKGTLPTPKVLESVYNGLVIRPIRSSNPDQVEYCGLLAVDTDDIERSEQYKFGITGVVNKRELLQKGDTVTFQVDDSGWATNIAAVRKKLIATVDTVKGQYGFLNYEAEEGKKLFFHQTEVKDKATLSPGDEVEFVIITNQKTGKSSACSIARIMPVGGPTRRPLHLLSKLKVKSQDHSGPRLMVTRQPKGPDGTSGFAVIRDKNPTLV